MLSKNDIPEELSSKASWIEKHLSSLQHPLKESVVHLALISEYVCRQIELFLSLLAEDPCDNLLPRAFYFEALAKGDINLDQSLYSKRLRQFRHTHLLRLLLLEKAGMAQTEAIMQSWSDCADALILNALNYCCNLLSKRYGKPVDEQGKPSELAVLAMGKLGGRELNYSSDVDLIFVYTLAGYTEGGERISNLLYFSKVVQLFVQILQNSTAEGFVFRVDLRLRPNGESGPLISSLSALETYYQEQGRDWERYAMVKARVLTEHLEEKPAWFARLILPFVYRRYVDFSVIESLRSMKVLIEREIQLNPRLDDIKRGQGGIREVEFIIQNVQLIRGGRLPQLQQQSTLSALAALKEAQLLPHSDALKQAYLFLRQLEHVLQSLNDQQTHSLPDDKVRQRQVTLALGFASWEEFLIRLHQYQRIVSHMFHSVLRTEDAYSDQKRLLENQLSSLWQGHIEETMAINLFTSLGFEEAEHCYQMLRTFRHGPRCRRLSQATRIRLDHFMVLVLQALIGCVETDKLLLQVLHLLEQIIGRSPYLALLTENPQVLKELFFLFANSPFISKLLVQQPFLLEVLLNQEETWKPLSRKKLELCLLEQLAHHPDLEAQEEWLRQFKLTHWLMAARAELYQIYNSVRIGQFLSDLAEVIIAQVLNIALQRLAFSPATLNQIKSSFSILAYGTFGSREMNYSSDLDLVFLHQVPVAEEALVIRLTQKILHMLTVRTQAGILYAVDTRLRPSGSAGLLVSPLDAFIEYQKKEAWTWEHQALLKARMISGKPQNKKAFLSLKQSILGIARDKKQLQTEVLAMRAKINFHLEAEPIKHAQGGLLDLEFLIQFLLLAYPEPGFAKKTERLSQIKILALAGVLSQNQAQILGKAYQLYQTLLHLNLLQPQLVSKKLIKVEQMQLEIAALCDFFYNC